MDGDTGHIKMTRVFRTSIITQLNKIKKNFVTPNDLGMTTYELRLATDCLHNNGVFRTMIFFN